MANYKDPSKEMLEGGRTVADAIGRGRFHGLKGVIVAPSAPDGLPINFNPHDKNALVITLDPDNTGRGSTLPLSAFTKEAVLQAIALAKNKIPGNDISDIRERAAVAFEELAKLANSGIVAKNKVEQRPALTTTQRPSGGHADNSDPSDYDNASAPPTADRGYSPMAAFGLKPAARGHATGLAGGALAAPATAPDKLLYFEKEGIGTVPAFFHDVIVDVNFDDDALTGTGFIVLVYNLGYSQSAARWFPPSTDPYQRPWALQINNDRRLYLVQTTGFQYVYDGKEFCILAVEKAVMAEN